MFKVGGATRGVTYLERRLMTRRGLSSLAFGSASGVAAIVMVAAGALPALAAEEPDSAFRLIQDAAPDVTKGVNDVATLTPDGLVYAVSSGVVTTRLTHLTL